MLLLSSSALFLPRLLDIPSPKLRLSLLVLLIIPSGPELLSCPNSLTLEEAVEVPPTPEVEATVGRVPSLVLILRTRAPRVSGGGAEVVIVGTLLELLPAVARMLPLRDPRAREREGEGGEVSRSREVDGL